MKARLTKTSVEAIAPSALDVYGWDDQLPGFGVKVTPTGARIYLLKYRFAGRQRWLPLGRHGEITVAEARQRATRARGMVAEGADPAAARSTKVSAPTVKDLAERYLTEHAETRKKPRSIEEDRRNLRRHLLPALGAVKVADVTRQDMLKLHHAMRATPSTANRVRALASTMFNLSEAWGMRPEATNPCRRVKKFTEKSRNCFLTGDELHRLGVALTEAEAAGEQPSALAIVRLLLLTGCRLTEITSLKWGFVDFERSCLRLPDSKTGSKVVRLAAPALDLLSKLPRFESPFVFPAARRGRSGPGHFIGVNHVWARIRAKAGLSDVRTHDLRHTFASWAVMGGTTLHVTAALLGHSQTATTSRYAHLADDPLQEAAERVGRALAGAMEERPKAAQLERVRP